MPSGGFYGRNSKAIVAGAENAKETESRAEINEEEYKVEENMGSTEE